MTYSQDLNEIREFIERCRAANAAQGDPVDCDIDCMTPGEREAYHDGMANAYAHVLQLIAPGRVTV